MRRRRMGRAIALVVVLVVLMGGVAHAQVELEPVVTGRANQYYPWANDDYLIYSQWSRARPDRYTVFAEPHAGGTRIQVNAVGTNASDTGGFDPGTNTLIYEQWTNRRAADLFFYDLDTGERTRVSGVNTRAWEWNPLISSTLIAFQREVFRNGEWQNTLRIRARADGETRAIRTWKDPAWAFGGSIGDRHLAYTLCTRRNCFAYLYDWETGTEQRIPSVNNKPQYAPVVDEVNAAVYFVRSGERCGRSVDIWRLPIDLTGEATKVVDLPRGIDTGWLSSLTLNGETGQMDLYVERWNCSERQGDIYVARGVDAEPTP